jgi:membrane-bound ClpP family serine protease
MTLIFWLFSIGILCIALEVIVPGGIIGAIGGLLMFGGCLAAFMNYGTSIGLVAVAVALAFTILVLFLEFRILPKTKIGKRAFLTAEITGVSAALGKEAQELIGKSAVALTLLSPSGYIQVDGQRYEAFCQSGQAPVGAAIKIIGADNFRLIVTQHAPL